MKKILLLIALFVFLLPGSLVAWKDLDYSRQSNWVMAAENKDGAVDLFYVLPTIFSDRNRANMQWHDSPELQQKALTIARQETGIFDGACRIFAPYYRQAEFRRALNELTLPPAERTCINRGVFDVKNAFRYYLKHQNNGRPFILFGFSQGAIALLEVMKTELAEPEVNERLIAAYLIGYPAMPKRFPEHPHLQPARAADDTGCIITYNSQAPGEVTSSFTGSEHSFCINPVNWRTDGTLASAAHHRGSRFFDRKSGKVTDRRHFLVTQVDPATGALLVIPQGAGTYDSEVLGKGVYHLYDLQFFYHDLRENIPLRIRSFLKRAADSRL